jgi:ubiquinone/menaquinone biosynthesis C-methylase UbiE
MSKRYFFLGALAGLALGAVLRQRRVSGLTQDRLQNYYHQRASFYNLTDYLYLGSFPRIEMRKKVIEMMDLKPGMRVLDVACGAGANFPYLMEKLGATGEIVGTDFSQDMLDSAHTQFVAGKGWNNITLVQGDAATMTFDKPFDAVICTLGLAVIPNWEQAMAQSMKALKNGGVYGVADLKESSRWYTLPIRFITDLMDVMIIADSTRKAWEKMPALGVDYRFEDLFHGYLYATTIRKNG